jgi:hypothetical protein
MDETDARNGIRQESSPDSILSTSSNYTSSFHLFFSISSLCLRASVFSLPGEGGTAAPPDATLHFLA